MVRTGSGGLQTATGETITGTPRLAVQFGSGRVASIGTARNYLTRFTRLSGLNGLTVHAVIGLNGLTVHVVSGSDCGSISCSM